MTSSFAIEEKQNIFFFFANCCIVLCAAVIMTTEYLLKLGSLVLCHLTNIDVVIIVMSFRPSYTNTVIDFHQQSLDHFVSSESKAEMCHICNTICIALMVCVIFIMNA